MITESFSTVLRLGLAPAPGLLHWLAAGEPPPLPWLR